MSRRILEGLGVAGRFARICGADDVPAKKPDPAGLRMLLDEAGIPPASAALVGDSAIDVRTGREAGVLTVGVTYGLDPSSLAAAPPDVLIGDLRELAPRLSEPFPA
jgi:phosphoglycolate phosphatase